VSSDFPLIARYLPGLNVRDVFKLPAQEVWRHGFSACRTNKPFVYATDLEAELAKGVQLFNRFDPSPDQSWTRNQYPDVTHSGLLIGIQEIQPESEPVRLIREFFKESPMMPKADRDHFLQMFRAFLERIGK
jgi:hypothetical protein